MSRLLRHGRGPRRGNSALIAALMVFPLCLLAGLGIDFGRLYVADARLTQAVDGAALAGARVLGSEDPTGDAQMYFAANFRAASEGVTLQPLVVTPGDNNRVLTVRAKGAIETTFLNLAGWPTLPLAASATARRTTMGMELALVLDVTGSMKANNAIGQLRVGAADLINILFGPEVTNEKLYISVVPYAAMLNIGPARTAWLDGGAVDQSLYAPHRWRGCIEARTPPHDESDDAYATRPFRPFLSRSTMGPETSPTPNASDNEWGVGRPPNDEASIDPKRSFTAENDRFGPNMGCGQPVSGLTNNRDQLLAIVGALQTTSRGGTMANVGLQAGWMTLSPKWRGLWGTSAWNTVTPAGFPLDYNTPFMKKVLVMMTDGANEWYDWPDQPPDSDFNAYGRRYEGRLGVTSASATTTELNNRMLRMCGAIKAQGITVYAITVDTGKALPPATRTLYQRCATSAGHHRHAPDAAELRTIFQQIGSELSNLRLES